MLCKAGADVNVEDRWGNNPIDDAKNAKKNSAAIMKLLENYGANKTSIVSTMSHEEEQEEVSGTIAYWPPELFSKALPLHQLLTCGPLELSCIFC